MIEEGHPLPEPDRRYWRRRVNRHVRKARRTRTLLRFSGILAMNLAVGAVLVVSGATVIRHFTAPGALGRPDPRRRGEPHEPRRGARGAQAVFRA